MQLIKNLIRRSFSLLALLLLAGTTTVAFGLTPTSQQIEMFKSLSPEQQRALASQYGVNLDDLGLGGNTAQPRIWDPRMHLLD